MDTTRLSDNTSLGRYSSPPEPTGRSKDGAPITIDPRRRYTDVHIVVQHKQYSLCISKQSISPEAWNAPISRLCCLWLSQRCCCDWLVRLHIPWSRCVKSVKWSKKQAWASQSKIKRKWSHASTWIFVTSISRRVFEKIHTQIWHESNKHFVSERWLQATPSVPLEIKSFLPPTTTHTMLPNNNQSLSFINQAFFVPSQIKKS